MKYILVLSAIVALFAFNIQAVTEGKREGSLLTGDEIMRKALDAIRLDGSEIMLSLVTRNSAGTVSKEMISVVSGLFSSGKIEKKLYRVMGDNHRGYGVLVHDFQSRDDNIWKYDPLRKETTKLGMEHISDRFLDSEFSYADLSDPNLSDFVHEELPETNNATSDTFIVDSVAKNRKVSEKYGFYRMVSHVDKNDFVTLKRYYYDRLGTLIKVMRAERVREYDRKKKRFKAMKLVMRNTRTKAVSEMNIEKIKYHNSIQNDLFTSHYLEKDI